MLNGQDLTLTLTPYPVAASTATSPVCQWLNARAYGDGPLKSAELAGQRVRCPALPRISG